MRLTPVTLLPLTLWLASTAAMATTVYKWVDAQGITHFSDQPHPQAQEIDVQPKNLVSGGTPPSAPANTQNAAPAGPAYRCELFRPENDEVFLNTSTITARLRLEPQLLPGDTIAVAIDGKRLTNQPTTGYEFIISDVERGTHTVMIGVYDRTNQKQLCLTSPVTFHVRQPSVQAPVKATRPRF
jgi:Domain of unknown function (DUF4124)